MVKNQSIFTGIIVCIIILALTACLPGGRKVISAQDATSTALKVTLEAFGTKVSFQPTKTPVRSFTPEISLTPGITLTPVPISTNTLPPTSTPAVKAGCYVAEYVSETISADVVMSPGRFFTKSWTIKNVGNCIWNKDFRFVFESGEVMTERESIEFLTGDILPGQSVTITVKMVASEEFGEHIGYWKIQTPEGYRFGTGTDSKALNVHLMVAPEDAADFKLTKVELFAVPNSYTGPCGKDGYPITLFARVSSNKAGVLHYTFIGTKGVQPKKSFTLTFFGADTQEIYYTFRIYKGIVIGWARLSAGDPIFQTYDKAQFNVTCN